MFIKYFVSAAHKKNAQLIILNLSFLVSGCATGGPAQRTPQTNLSPYQGCLLFLDDAKSASDMKLIEEFKPRTLLRSWYRWGEPPPEKRYASRSDFVKRLKAEDILLGGGTSLSVVNENDFKDPKFDKSWLSLKLNGLPVQQGGHFFGTISAPGFRKYLIEKVIEQVRLGVVELHFGETNGDIHYDEWSLGLKNENGFLQWLRQKYAAKEKSWWQSYFGEIGEAIYAGTPIEFKAFGALPEPFLSHFKSEWGVEGSWSGLNVRGQPAFLATLYHQNLDLFLGELRSALKAEGSESTSIDIWGFADWMHELKNTPDAFMSTPPDERWGMNWATQPAFSLEKNRDRMKAIMAADIRSFSPVPVIYMIDHPKPFTAFRSLSEVRQAQITSFLLELTKELNSKFVLRVPGPVSCYGAAGPYH